MKNWLPDGAGTGVGHRHGALRVVVRAVLGEVLVRDGVAGAALAVVGRAAALEDEEALGGEPEAVASRCSSPGWPGRSSTSCRLGRLAGSISMTMVAAVGVERDEVLRVRLERRAGGGAVQVWVFVVGVGASAHFAGVVRGRAAGRRRARRARGRRRGRGGRRGRAVAAVAGGQHESPDGEHDDDEAGAHRQDLVAATSRRLLAGHGAAAAARTCARASSRSRLLLLDTIVSSRRPCGAAPLQRTRAR